MDKLFVDIYLFFRRNRPVYWLLLVLSTALFGFFASKVEFEENINSFFPKTGNNSTMVEVFDNLTVKDNIFIMISHADSGPAPEDGAVSGSACRQEMIRACDEIKAGLLENAGDKLINGIISEIGPSEINASGNYIYDNLPLFLDDEDYARIDSLMDAGAIEGIMKRNYMNLVMPSGFVMKDFIMRDPLNFSGRALKSLQDLQVENGYDIVDGHIFTKDGNILLLMVYPRFNTGSTGKNEPLVKILEEELAKAGENHPSLEISYFGGPSVGVYNAMQMKTDTLFTSMIAIAVIVLFISLVFKKKRNIWLIVVPALYGVLFSLCLIYFMKGRISSIAVGAGSAVLGIALSYSIHMLAHQNHVNSVEQLIKELVYPLTIGSFTTIGAFVSLLFTSSSLLKDFGLFAALALIGTILFCLVFLPYFLGGHAREPENGFLKLIERFSAIHFEENKALIVILAVLTVVCCFTMRKVEFDDDMSSINYVPAHLAEAERKLSAISEEDGQNVLFISTGHSFGEAVARYSGTESRFAGLKAEGLIKDYSSASRFFIPEDEQLKRIDKWNGFWTDARKEKLTGLVSEAASESGFREGAFNSFFEWLDKDFKPADYDEMPDLFGNWCEVSSGLTMLITNVRMTEKDKETVYPMFSGDESTVIFDREYFANAFVAAVNHDFYLVLYFSSILIFIALCLSYGRLELALMSFLPMFISWIIIVGIMGIIGLKFNIINIILSTFIFGIGDDFSIFIMDGLIYKYKYGRNLLDNHKTAIFFSAFTIFVGIGALVFAKHPALQSIAAISIFGILAVVLVAYILQPILFRLFISAPASKGLPPVTLWGVFRTAALFGTFFVLCMLIRLYTFILYAVPIKKKHKRLSVSWAMHVCCRMILGMAFFLKKTRVNPSGESFAKPAVTVANHQSFIDILAMLAMTPKTVMVTNKWVWKSPVFGGLVRYAGFYCTENGFENAAEHFRPYYDEGYSIVVFPEGTRSADGAIHRFHKGAFYLAEALNADIVPVVLYGNGRAIPKNRPYYIRKSTVGYKILGRISPSDLSWGTTYQERTKNIAALVRKEYEDFCRLNDVASNPYFHENLIQNYTFKGPVTEWYNRVKIRMEGNYAIFDEIVPRSGRITDIGCGMGALCFMLSQLSSRRIITGIDYDEDKIAVADNGWLKNGNMSFIAANAVEFDLPESDVFIMNDMLHYLPAEDQKKLIANCISRLAPGGMLIIRDGDSGKAGKHKVTELTEVLSTKIFKFNKTDGALCFFSDSMMEKTASDYGMKLRKIANDRYTSNTIYVLTME